MTENFYAETHRVLVQVLEKLTGLETRLDELDVEATEGLDPDEVGDIWEDEE